MSPRLPQALLPHPVYENFGPPLSKTEARAQLGITAERVLLFFGYVRPYKGLDRLLDAMPEILRRQPQCHLFVVGEFLEKQARFDDLIRLSGVQRKITLVNRYVRNDEVRTWFSAADLVILPYRSATNSGIVQIAYNFATPVIVTNVGNLSEIVIDGHTGFVLKDASAESIAGAVDNAFTGDTLERLSAAIRLERWKYSWDSFVAGIEQLVQRS